MEKPSAPNPNTIEKSRDQERDGNLPHSETEDAKRLRNPINLD
jgi:hypothetical protein